MIAVSSAATMPGYGRYSLSSYIWFCLPFFASHGLMRAASGVGSRSAVGSEVGLANEIVVACLWDCVYDSLRDSVVWRVLAPGFPNVVAGGEYSLECRVSSVYRPLVCCSLAGTSVVLHSSIR